MELTTGTRIYNHGDRANLSHFGTITKIETDRWGTHLHITPDPDTDRKPYFIEPHNISKVYAGNGLTRFVLESEYDRYRTEKIAEMAKRYHL